jgi:epoxyqueuosine reductase
MKSALVDFTRALGFDLCRVARAVEPLHAQAFRQWLAAGCAGEMAWMERNAERRTDPQLVLPGAKSVVVLAMNYWQGDTQQKGSMERIARYAWNDDYHDFITPKLRAIDEFLQQHGGIQRGYADTGPVLERDFGAMSGIGWQGKSTMLINPKLGAWFFLAEVLTTLDLPPDEPMPNRCGNCARCMDACPTGAIAAPHRLDAMRCISYLTIEHKGSIPEALRPLIGGRIYGCDECATACPWNRFAKASQEAAFVTHPAVQLGLRELLALDDEQFRTLFRGSPIARIKRRGMLRNVCVALGNTGTADDLPALARAALDPEPLIAEHARWAIQRLQQRAIQSVTNSYSLR